MIRALRLMCAGVMLAACAQDIGQLSEPQRNDAEFCERAGVAHLRAGDFAKARPFFEQALKLRPGLVAARKNLGIALWFLGEKERSEREFAVVLRSRSDDPIAHLYLGLAAYDHKDYPGASGHFEKAGDLAFHNPEVRPLAIESLLGAAEKYDRGNAPARAYAAYRKALALDPKSEAPYAALAAFASAHGNPAYARKVLEQGLDRLPGSARLLFQKGLLFGLEGRLEEAQTGFEQARCVDPRWPLPLMALGVTQLERGRTAEAVETFRAAAAHPDDDYRPHYLYALALHRSGNPELRPEAIAALKRAIEISPLAGKPRALLGQIYLEQSDTRAAVAELEKATQAEPDNPTGLYQLSVAYRQAGDPQRAARALTAFRAAKAKAKGRENEFVQVLRILQ